VRGHRVTTDSASATANVEMALVVFAVSVPDVFPDPVHVNCQVIVYVAVSCWFGSLIVECWYWYWQPDGDESHGPFTPDRHTDPGPRHDTAGRPSPGVKLSSVGVAVTAAHTTPSDARAVYDLHVEASAQIQVSARTTVYGCPDCNLPAGYRPAAGLGNSNDAAACRASAAGDGGGVPPAAAGGSVGHPFAAKNAFNATGSSCDRYCEYKSRHGGNVPLPRPDRHTPLYGPGYPEHVAGSATTPPPPGGGGGEEPPPDPGPPGPTPTPTPTQFELPKGQGVGESAAAGSAWPISTTPTIAVRASMIGTTLP